MKKITSVFLATVLLLSVCGLSVSANNSFTKTENGVTLTVTLDKPVYSVGETITVTVSIKNNSGVDLYYMPSSYAVYTKICRQDNSKFNGPMWPSVDSPSWGTLKAGEEEIQVLSFDGRYTPTDPNDHRTNPWVEAGVYAGNSVFDYNTVKPEQGKEDEWSTPYSLSLDFTVELVGDVADIVTPPTSTIANTMPVTLLPTATTTVDAPEITENDNTPAESATVPNPPTDSGSIPAISLALIGASVLILCSKKKK